MIWPILRLLWSPQSLGAAAMHCPAWLALSVGLIVFSLEASILLCLDGIGIAEPWATMTSYFRTAIGWVFMFGWLIAIPVALIVIPIWVSTDHMRPEKAPLTRMLLLVPVPLFAPIVGWGFFAACREATGNIVSGHPGWMNSAAVAVLSSRWWFWFFAGLAVLYTIMGAARIRTLQQLQMRVCSNCDYPIGSSPVCTECGAVVNQSPS